MKTGSTIFLADYTPTKELWLYFSYILNKLGVGKGIKTSQGLRAWHPSPGMAPSASGLDHDACG